MRSRTYIHTKFELYTEHHGHRADSYKRKHYGTALIPARRVKEPFCGFTFSKFLVLKIDVVCANV